MNLELSTQTNELIEFFNNVNSETNYNKTTVFFDNGILLIGEFSQMFKLNQMSSPFLGIFYEQSQATKNI